MIFHKLTINRLVLLIYIFAFVYLITAWLTGDSLKLWMSVFVGAMAYSYLLIALWQRNRLVPLKGEYRIELLNEAVKCHFGNGKSQQMLWSDIRRVSVRKLAKKNEMSEPEVWLRLHSYPWRKVLSIPSRAIEFETLYQRLSNLDKFDGSKFNQAMYSEKSATFTLWEKDEF